MGECGGEFLLKIPCLANDTALARRFGLVARGVLFALKNITGDRLAGAGIARFDFAHLFHLFLGQAQGVLVMRDGMDG